MTGYPHPAIAVGVAIFLWWFSTGIVFVIARKGENHEWPVAVGASVVAVMALAALYLTADSMTVAGAYIAFGAALIVWGWHELMFLLRFITGPRQVSATPGLRGLARFREAFAAMRDHEVAIAGTALLVLALTWDATNVVGLWTFILLWIMRITAKLSIFLGARNSLSEMMPERLAYLKSYFRTDRTTLLLPAVIAVAGILLLWIVAHSGAALSPHHAVGGALLASLLALAILEHLLLMLPVRDAVLWVWAVKPTKTNEISTSGTPGTTNPAPAKL